MKKKSDKHCSRADCCGGRCGKTSCGPICKFKKIICSALSPYLEEEVRKGYMVIHPDFKFVEGGQECLHCHKQWLRPLA